MNEWDLIEAIRKSRQESPFDLTAGIGEDAAVLSCGKKELLVTCEALVEGTHFQRRWGSWEDWGKKAAGSALSDIAAMGGMPRFAFIDLHLPKNFADKNVAAFYKGLDFLFIPLKIAVAGGNLARSPSGFSASLTLLGERPAVSKMLRSDAQPGDLLFLAGNIGWAALGLKLLQKKKREPLRYLQAFRHPQPLLAAGRWLLQNKIARACIDVSDGLCQDAGHLARASAVTITIEADKIPLDSRFQTAAGKLKCDPLQLALAGGEDYALLFTAEASKAKILIASGRARPIGFVSRLPADRQRKKSRVRVIDSTGKTIKMKQEGFSHF